MNTPLITRPNTVFHPRARVCLPLPPYHRSAQPWFFRQNAIHFLHHSAQPQFFCMQSPAGQCVLEMRNARLSFPVGPGGQSAPKGSQVARAVMVWKDLVFQEQRGYLLFRGWLDIPFAEQPVKLFEHALVFIWMV